MTSKIALGALALSSLLGANLAQAYDGTVTVTGQLDATTCTVTAASPAGSGAAGNVALTLPTLTITSLTANNVAGTTPFTITAGGSGTCATRNNFQVFFEGSSNVNAEGRIVPNEFAARQVTLQLLNQDGSVIDASKATPAAQGVKSGSLTGTTTKTGALSFLVGYHAVNVANVRPGPVTGSINYSVTYQ